MITWRLRHGAAAASLLVSLGLVLAARGSTSGSITAKPPRAHEDNPPRTPDQFPCGPEQSDCSPDEVIATVTRIYILGGATMPEATSLAPITGEGKHAVNQTFDVPKPGETEAAIECVGSEARLRTITKGVGDYLKTLVPYLASS